ncbi:MAG TPA: hypothetical protein VFJ94_03900, partial [Intrasporangium sp.]|uniref:hypothetical protein n=1 Tax=Intrasporangium sp. TaxID=1925024 RepID=UPI002D782D9F
MIENEALWDRSHEQFKSQTMCATALSRPGMEVAVAISEFGQPGPAVLGSPACDLLPEPFFDGLGCPIRLTIPTDPLIVELAEAASQMLASAAGDGAGTLGTRRALAGTSAIGSVGLFVEAAHGALRAELACGREVVSRHRSHLHDADGDGGPAVRDPG